MQWYQVNQLDILSPISGLVECSVVIVYIKG